MLKVLACVGFSPSALSFMPAHLRIISSNALPSRENEYGFRRRRSDLRLSASTKSAEPPPEPWQVVSLAEDEAFWLELQGEVFDESVLLQELER